MGKNPSPHTRDVFIVRLIHGDVRAVDFRVEVQVVSTGEKVQLVSLDDLAAYLEKWRRLPNIHESRTGLH